MKKVYICSPYRAKDGAELDRNIDYAQQLTRQALEAGLAPITPHLYMTQCMDDKKPEERARGMAAGLALLKGCDFVIAGVKYGITEGMDREIHTANMLGITVIDANQIKRHLEYEQKKEKYHNTFTLMKCYRDAVFHIENAISDGQQLELKGMTDEQQRTYLESIRRTRFKTLIMTAHIDKAVEEIERRREAAGRGVEYKAFEMYFMQGMDYAEIAEQLDTGKNTPRRWVTGIINELSVLLWGIDEERVK